MAVSSVTVTKKGVWGDRRAHQATIVFSGSYVLGGESVTAANFGLTVLEDVIVHGATVDATPSALVASYNSSTGKILHFTSNGAAPANLAEKTAAAYGTTPTLRVTAIGW